MLHKTQTPGSSRLAVAVFALIALAVYWPVMGGRIPVPHHAILQFAAWNGFPSSEALRSYADIGDLITTFYPFRSFVSQAVAAGTLPLWNPYLLGGTPFLANSQSSLFYPLNIPYYVLPTPAAWVLAIVLRTFLA